MRSPVAGKLNQVTPVDLGYLPYEALRDLVSEPTSDVLRFDDAAIDRIIYWSACNPFYANRICNQLWNFLIEKRWTSVVADDVERVVNEIVSRDDSPLFSHFWLDGIWGEEEAQKAAISSNCIVLYAFGRLSMRNPDSRYFSFQEIRAECRYLTEDDLRKWLGDLVAREVIEKHSELADHYALRVPYFQLWLAKKGQSELYSSLDPGMLVAVQEPEKEFITDEELEALVGEPIRYRTGTVGVYEVRKFLKQFGSGANQRLVYKLVKKLVQEGFYSLSNVQDAAAKATQILYKRATAASPGFVKQLDKSGVWKNVFVVLPSGPSVTSFQALADIIRQRENLSKMQTGTHNELVDFLRSQKGPVAVLLFDDVIGTGATAAAMLRETLNTADGSGQAGNIASILFYAVVGFRGVIDDLNRQFDGKAVVEVYRQLTEADQAFSPDAGIFDTDDERETARKLVESIGTKLDPRWPLGYGGRQALISFYRNTPNITLPIFHKSSRKANFRWQPLFRRM